MDMNHIPQMTTGKKILESYIGSIIKVSLGALLGVIIWSYYSECVYVEINAEGPPRVFLWNEITQQKGKEVK